MSSLERRRPIIADVDVGIDDAWALFMLLKAETAAHPLEHRLLGVTCVKGNVDVDQVVTNVLRVLQVADRPDVSVYGSRRILENTFNINETRLHSQVRMLDSCLQGRIQ